MIGPTLVIGTEGLVGSNRFGFDKGRNILAPREQELDITDKEKVRNYIDETRPASIILLAAYTNVDGAEKNRDLAWKVNVEGVENVAAASRGVGAFLIYISTDFIFPGTKDSPGPHSEDEVPPEETELRGWYAETKYQGEKAVLRLEGQTAAIVRIAFPFGNVSSPRDYTRKILGAVNAGYPLFTDQHLSPTFISDFWQALDKVEREKRAGVWHVATRPVTTPYEFASYLVGRLGLQKKIKEGSLKEFLKRPGVAPRYFFGGLKTEKTEKKLGLTFKTWQEAIDEVVPELQKTI